MASRLPVVVVTKDHVNEVLKSIDTLTASEVLVGFPESEAARETQGAAAAVTNAYLGYIHEHGSPQQNIPARPFLEPGVEDSLPEVTPVLEEGARKALAGDRGAAARALQIAGVKAASSAKRKINTGPFVPLSPKTILKRRYSRNTQSMRPAEKRYFELLNSGMSPQAAQDTAGIKPLINTGQLRNAITYVVRRSTR